METAGLILLITAFAFAALGLATFDFAAFGLATLTRVFGFTDLDLPGFGLTAFRFTAFALGFRDRTRFAFTGRFRDGLAAAARFEVLAKT